MLVSLTCGARSGTSGYLWGVRSTLVPALAVKTRTRPCVRWNGASIPGKLRNVSSELEQAKNKWVNHWTVSKRIHKSLVWKVQTVFLFAGTTVLDLWISCQLSLKIYCRSQWTGKLIESISVEFIYISQTKHLRPLPLLNIVEGITLNWRLDSRSIATRMPLIILHTLLI